MEDKRQETEDRRPKTINRSFVSGLRSPVAFLLVVLLVGASLVQTHTATFAQSEEEEDAGRPRFFVETGFTVAYSFREFYESYGDEPVFGPPATQVFLAEGRPVQYFARARLEWHAEDGTVHATPLGHWAAQSGHGGHVALQPLATAPPDAVSIHDPALLGVPLDDLPDTLFVPDTGHTLQGAFKYFWFANGGAAAFGYPISQELTEQQPDGKPYVIQYFDRARFAYNPETNEVVLGDLGWEHLYWHPAPEWAMQPVQSVEQAWDGVRPTHVTIPRVGVDTEVIEAGFSYQEWDIPLDAAAHYWPLAAYPGTAGNIIISGHVGYQDVIFNHLPNVDIGDEIFVTVAGQDHRYVVREIHILLPQDSWVLSHTPTETLTLITCVPIGIFTHRLVVRAEPESEPVAPPQAQPQAPPHAPQPNTPLPDLSPILMLPRTTP